MNIKTSYWRKPGPSKAYDWEAWDDDTYDGPPCPVGTGATEQEAIDDLLTLKRAALPDPDFLREERAERQRLEREYPSLDE